MKIETGKQLLSIIADEINVKEVVLRIAETEVGMFDLVYKKEDDDLHLSHDGNRVLSKKLNAMIPEFLDSAFSQNK